MQDLLALLDRMGKAGGAIVTLIGLAGVIFFLADTEALGEWEGRYPPAGGWIVGFLISLLVVGLGGSFLVRKRPPPAAEDRDTQPLEPNAYLDALENRTRPFVTCTDCRIIIEWAVLAGECPRCGKVPPVLRVETTEDVELAKAAASSTAR